MARAKLEFSSSGPSRDLLLQSSGTYNLYSIRLYPKVSRSWRTDIGVWLDIREGSERLSKLRISFLFPRCL
jgi:hypothetical protein